jgi:hypothetical protein
MVFTLLQGDSDTFDYRVFVEKKGKKVSVWHDIPLFAESGNLNFVVEIPKESSAKMEAATVSVPFCLCFTRNQLCQRINKITVRFAARFG